MEILGIGASELVFIILIAIIILGPRDMQKAGRTMGRWLNQLVTSDSWKVFQRTSTELRNLPRNLMREANAEFQDVDKELKEIRQTIDPRYHPPASASAPSRSLPPSNEAETNAQAAVPREAPSKEGGGESNPAVPTEQSSNEDGTGSTPTENG